MHKLIAFIGEDDFDITLFFPDHYRRLGVREFHIIVRLHRAETQFEAFQNSHSLRRRSVPPPVRAAVLCGQRRSVAFSPAVFFCEGLT